MMMTMVAPVVAIVPQCAGNAGAGRIANYPACNETNRTGYQRTGARAHHAIYYPAFGVSG